MPEKQAATSSRPARMKDDAAMTLIELVVGMSLMAVFLAMTTPLFVRLYATQNLTELMSTAQSQANTAFLRLDTEIRYAGGISTPGQVGSDWYVEYVTSTGATPVCTELRLTAAGQFQRRSWSLGSPPGTSFTVLMAGLTGGASTVPFTVTNPGGQTIVQRLAIHLTAGAAQPFDVAFTALNSGSGASNVATCLTDGRS